MIVMEVSKLDQIAQAWVVARRDLEEQLSQLDEHDPQYQVICQTIEETEQKIQKLTTIPMS